MPIKMHGGATTGRWSSETGTWSTPLIQRFYLWYLEGKTYDYPKSLADRYGYRLNVLHPIFSVVTHLEYLCFQSMFIRDLTVNALKLDPFECSSKHMCKVVFPVFNSNYAGKGFSLKALDGVDPSTPGFENLIDLCKYRLNIYLNRELILKSFLTTFTP